MQAIQEFKRAMRRNRLEEADALLTELPDGLPVEVQESVGLLHVIRARWAEAAATLGAIRKLSGDLQVLGRYAANMAALQQYRPELFDAVSELPESDRYEVVTGAAGRLTIGDTQTGQFVVANANGGSLEDVALQAIDRVEQEKAASLSASLIPVSVMVLGMGDGRALQAIFDLPKKAELMPSAAIHVLESDLYLFKSCLFIHDWSGEGGLIGSSRVVWCVGDDCAGQWFEAMQQDLRCPLPQTMLRLGVQAGDVEEQVRGFVDQINDKTLEISTRINTYYDGQSDYELAVSLTFGNNRPPRALWIASRFTTVVQHSASDAVDGLRRGGVDAEVIIEAEEHHQLTTRYLVDLIDRYRPDVLMSINYMRQQFQNGLPAGLPVFTWLQDEVGGLMSKEVGRSIDRRQFIGTCSPAFYVKDYDYPEPQVLYLNKLTCLPDAIERPPVDQSDPVMVFVSNAARTPGQLLDDLMERCDDEPITRHLAEGTAQWLFDLYNKGQHCHSPTQLLPVLGRVAEDASLPKPGEEGARRLAMLIFSSVNNTLYRQEAVRWAQQAAEAAGLELHLYGQGWSQNPEFARYDRGYAAYGGELERITRAARINLQIVPFNCMHQRLIDGWAAGGFYLVREHPSDRLNQMLQKLFPTLPPSASSVAQWRAALDEPQRADLDKVLEMRELTMMDAREDLVGGCTSTRQKGFVPGSAIPPRLDDVWFGSQDQFQQQVQRYAEDHEARARVVLDQQAFLRFTGMSYTEGMRRTIGLIAEGLGTIEEA